MKDYPSTHSDAVAVGSRFYFTGKPCKHGHISLRKTCSYNCIECCKKQNKSNSKVWRDKNKSKTLEYHNRQRLTGGKPAIRRVTTAVAQGVLLDLKEWIIACTDCQASRATEYDHRDYNYPLLVEPVCRSCNRLRGKAIPVGGIQ